jgi:hypothetical protein
MSCDPVIVIQPGFPLRLRFALTIHQALAQIIEALDAVKRLSSVGRKPLNSPEPVRLPFLFSFSHIALRTPAPLSGGAPPIFGRDYPQILLEAVAAIPLATRNLMLYN